MIQQESRLNVADNTGARTSWVSKFWAVLSAEVEISAMS